ncbi:MAG: ABC transporter ATP-binding protein [Chitinophagaceae bacterium]
MPSIVTLSGISKRYGSIQALDDVSFEVPQGTIFGLLGPNGSGKTTLLGIILNVLRQDRGSYQLFEQQPSEKLRRQMGTLLETPNFYHYLSGADNLALCAAIKGRGKEAIPEVLEKVGLLSRKDSKFSTYSLGMKQRLAIAATLLGDPPVLVLDEPTNGLDPVGISEIRNLVRHLAGQGKTIIMASHLLDEVEKVCTHVAILKKGRLLSCGTVDEVLLNEEVVEVGSEDLLRLEEIMRRFCTDGMQMKIKAPFIQISFSSSPDLEAINRYCFEQGVVLSHLFMRRKSLESKFIELTREPDVQQ